MGLDETVIRNGTLVSDLLASEVWREILSPLFDEAIASVAGRKTSGRWQHGDFTRGKENADFLRGYQKGAMDTHNHILDFVVAKQKVEDRRKQEQAEKVAPLVNTFLEDQDE